MMPGAVDAFGPDDWGRQEPEWRLVKSDPPPEREVVATKSEGGMEQTLKRSGRLFFVPDGSMYVYYTPKWWRPIPVGPDGI
jgi:hypothetical protein